jgi:hypothetical protein
MIRSGPILCNELPRCHLLISSDTFDPFDGVRYLLNEADPTALAVSISDASLKIPEKIIAHDATWIRIAIAIEREHIRERIITSRIPFAGYPVVHFVNRLWNHSLWDRLRPFESWLGVPIALLSI